jgi:hypothetical protein
MRPPSLPLRLHKEEGDETLIFIAFLLLQMYVFRGVEKDRLNGVE